MSARHKHYAVSVIDFIEEYISKDLSCKAPIVEVGCGRGDIIGRIRYSNKIVVDISPEVLKATRLLFRGTKFIPGTFDDVNIGDIRCLIMVNFIHGISPEDMRRYMKGLLSRNNVELVCFDSFSNIEYTEFRYTHTGENLLGDDYEPFHIGYKDLADHASFKHIEYWRRKK